MRFVAVILCVTMLCPKSFCQSKDGSEPPKEQTALQTIENIPSKSLDFVSTKYAKLTNDIQLKSEKLLNRMQQQEAKLQKKLQKIDSAKAQELFSRTQTKYQELQSKLRTPIDKTVANPLIEYIPGIDSLQTMLKFLSQSNVSGIASNKLQQIY